MVPNNIDERLEKILDLKKTVFELSVVVFDHLIHSPCQYPWYKVKREVIGYFSSLGIAKETLNKYDGFSQEKVFCYYIREFALDILNFCTEYRVISYTPNKEELIDIFNFGMAKKDGSRGLDAAGQIVGTKFRVGDLVYYLDGDEVRLGIISLLPFGFDGEFLDEKYEQLFKMIEADSEEESDNSFYSISGPCYTILFGTGICVHEHPLAVQLFPAPKTLPIPIKEMLCEDLRIVQEFDEHYGEEGFKEYPRLWEKSYE